MVVCAAAQNCAIPLSERRPHPDGPGKHFFWSPVSAYFLCRFLLPSCELANAISCRPSSMNAARSVDALEKIWATSSAAWRGDVDVHHQASCACCRLRTSMGTAAAMLATSSTSSAQPGVFWGTMWSCTPQTRPPWQQMGRCLAMKCIRELSTSIQRIASSCAFPSHRHV